MAGMTADEHKLRNAIRHYGPAGGNASAVRELALGPVAHLCVQRTLLPALRLSTLPTQSLAVLDLSKNRLGPHAFSCLMYAVAGAPASLRELDVSWNMATADCSAAVGHMLSSNATLQKLVISNNPLTTCIGEDLGKALTVNRTLKCLEMQACGLMDGLALFEGMGGHPALTSLNVSSNSCGAAAWIKFGQSMSAGLALSSLQARSAGVGREGASALAAGIRSQKAMTNLDVSGCKLGASEAGELLEALSTCAGVKRVVMAENQFKGGEVARSLATLCNKSELEFVDLSNCEISSESAKECLKSLAGGKNVAAFSLAGIGLDAEVGLALKAVLMKKWKAERRATTVLFGGNNVEKLFHADVMADDFDETEGEGAWLPDDLDLSDSKATPEVLEAVVQIFEAGEGACALRKLRLDGNVMVSLAQAHLYMHLKLCREGLLSLLLFERPFKQISFSTRLDKPLF